MEENKVVNSDDVKLEHMLPMGNTVVFKLIDQEIKRKSGIIIPQSKTENYVPAEVIWVGPGVERCRIGHKVTIKMSRVYPIAIEEQGFYFGREDLCVEFINDFFKHGGSLNSLIAQEQAKRIVGKYFEQHKDMAPDLVKNLAAIIQEEMKK